MAAVLEMTSSERVKSSQGSVAQNLSSGETFSMKNNMDISDKEGIADKMVQIDIGANTDKCFDKVLSKDSKCKTVPTSIDFSEEKDAPEPTTLVYDFNMVKQKTLPRISFGNEGMCSSRSQTHIIICVLMSASIVVCVVLLILFLAPDLIYGTSAS